MAKQLGIMTALAPEAALVQRLLGCKSPTTVAVGALWHGRLADLEVVLLRCGMGPERAALGATWLANHTALWGMLSIGFAGGLHTYLATGDAFLATHIVALSATPEVPGFCASDVLTPTPDLYKVATAAAEQAALSMRAGRLLSVPTVISQAAVKQRLGETSGALAVDMESYCLGRIARQYDLAFVTLRTIFDTAEEALPFQAEAFTSPDGVLQPGRFWQYLWRHPHLIAHVPHAWWQSRVAGCCLQKWLQSFLTLLADTPLPHTHG